jgi:hypothetical protein
LKQMKGLCFTKDSSMLICLFETVVEIADCRFQKAKNGVIYCATMPDRRIALESSRSPPTLIVGRRVKRTKVRLQIPELGI